MFLVNDHETAQQTECVEFIIPVALPLTNVWQRMHFVARADYMRSLSALIQKALPCGWLALNCQNPFRHALVTVERWACGKAPDPDGLCGVYKPLLDVLVYPTDKNPHGLGIIIDDAAKNVDLDVVAKYSATRAETRTVVRIFGTGRTAEKQAPFIPRPKPKPKPKPTKPITDSSHLVLMDTPQRMSSTDYRELLGGIPVAPAHVQAAIPSQQRMTPAQYHEFMRSNADVHSRRKAR